MKVLVFGSLMLSCCGVCDVQYKRTDPMPDAVCEKLAEDLQKSSVYRSEFFYCEEINQPPEGKE